MPAVLCHPNERAEGLYIAMQKHAALFNSSSHLFIQAAQPTFYRLLPRLPLSSTFFTHFHP
jgi:hypothetical protein